MRQQVEKRMLEKKKKVILYMRVSGHVMQDPHCFLHCLVGLQGHDTINTIENMVLCTETQ